MENRARFMLEALGAIVSEIGQEKSAIRLSPFASMDLDDYDPFETFGYVTSEIKKRFPNLGYVSFTDPRWTGERSKNYSNDYFRAIIRGIPVDSVSKFDAGATTVFPDPDPDHPTLILSAGGYSASDAESISERTGDIVGFGRIFISNPDLVYRLKNGLELNPYDRSTFYSNDNLAVGYIDYPFATSDTKKFVPITELKPEDALAKLSEALKHERSMLGKARIESNRREKDFKVQIEKATVRVQDLETIVNQKSIDGAWNFGELELIKNKLSESEEREKAAVLEIETLKSQNLALMDKINLLSEKLERSISIQESDKDEIKIAQPAATPIMPSTANETQNDNSTSSHAKEGFNLFCLNISMKK
jgi:hypothetical protein